VEFLATTNKALSGWPFHQYAVNAGAGLMNTHLDKQTGKNAVPYHCVNLGQIVKDRRPKTDIVKSLKKVLVPFIAVAGISILVVTGLSQNKLQASIDTLQTDLNAAEAELKEKQTLAAEAGKVEENINEITNRTTEINAGRQQIFSAVDYIKDVTSIVGCMPGELTFNTLEMTIDEITIQGSSYKAYPVVEFADNLESAGGFAQAIITWIDRPHDIPGMDGASFFRIIITRETG
jgi:Tfp pilus assembly protein PilN